MNKHFHNVAFALLCPVMAMAARAQSGCENGIVRLPAGINGSITICPAVAAQDPGLTRQIAELRAAMSGQQEQLAQLLRLMKDINQVSGPLGVKRQAELLANVTQRLGDAHAVTGAQLQQRANTLSGHFEDVSTQLSAAQANPSEAAQTNAAMQGSMGDAITRLDFDTVTNQLSDIQATVHSIDQRTKNIEGAIDDFRAEQQKNQQAGAEAAQKLQEHMLADPSQFVIVNLTAMGQLGGPGKLIVALGHPAQPALTGAKMQIAFASSGQESWVVDLPIPHITEFNSTTMVDVQKIGDHAVVCFSAVDPRVNQRRLWRKAFIVASQSMIAPYGGSGNPNRSAFASRFSTLAFQPDSEATLTPDSDAPCR